MINRFTIRIRNSLAFYMSWHWTWFNFRIRIAC